MDDREREKYKGRKVSHETIVKGLSKKRGFYDMTARQIDGWTEVKIERQTNSLRQRKKRWGEIEIRKWT